jgi:hypothetical protein
MVDTWVQEDGQWALKRIPYSDPRAKRFLKAYVPAVFEHLKEKGWNKFYMQGIADEPLSWEVDWFAEGADLVRKRMPGVPIVEPVDMGLNLDFLRKNVDVWVMRLQTIARQEQEVRQQLDSGRTLWFYTYLSPHGRYPNRFIDFSLLKVRILHWMNYKYRLPGYLHWGLNAWYQEDPYKNTQPVINQGKTYLPPGDAFITYPNRTKKSLNSSIRFEEMREGIEDYGLLDELRKKDPEKARQISEQMVQTFTEYVRDPTRFRTIYRGLLASLD